MTRSWLAVEPLDTIMVRDGRPFDAGTSSTARGVAPPPNTLGGVVGAALGRRVDQIVGPLVLLEDRIAFPAPADLITKDGQRKASRLAVRERRQDARTDLDTHRRLSHYLVGEGKPPEHWLTGTGMRRWLDHSDDEDGFPYHTEPPWQPESRLGLARHPDGELAGTAVTGMFYAMSQLRPRPGLRLVVGCDADGPLEIRDDLVPLGGRGRLAQVSGWPGFDRLPDPPTGFPGGRVSVYLATPALLADMFWQPAGARLCAVACAGPQPLASATPGADFARTRLLAWTVPAGTVFYLRFDDDSAAERFVVEHHGGLLPGGSAQPIRTAGFGTCLMGRW